MPIAVRLVIVNQCDRIRPVSGKRAASVVGRSAERRLLCRQRVTDKQRPTDRARTLNDAIPARSSGVGCRLAAKCTVIDSINSDDRVLPLMGGT